MWELSRRSRAAAADSRPSPVAGKTTFILTYCRKNSIKHIKMKDFQKVIGYRAERKKMRDLRKYIWNKSML